MNITVRGVLSQAPEHRTTLEGEAALIVHVAPTSPGLPVEARLILGDEFSRAEAIAGMARRGDEVTVGADGAISRTDTVVLVGVNAVELRGAYGCFVVPKVVR